MSEDLVTRLSAAIDQHEHTAKQAADWSDQNAGMPPAWTTQQWADPDQTAIVADPESSAYPVAQLPDEPDGEPSRFAGHIMLHDPKAALRVCAADRKLLALCTKPAQIDITPLGQFPGSVFLPVPGTRPAWIKAVLANMADRYGIEP